MLDADASITNEGQIMEIVQRVLRTFDFRVGGSRPGFLAATSCFSGAQQQVHGSMTR